MLRSRDTERGPGLPAALEGDAARRHLATTMNLFRLLGDLSHLASIFILIHKILTSRSCRGISFKTQLMYTIVFVTRYLDLLHPPSAYLILMKLFFISSLSLIHI